MKTSSTGLIIDNNKLRVVVYTKEEMGKRELNKELRKEFLSSSNQMTYFLGVAVFGLLFYLINL